MVIDRSLNAVSSQTKPQNFDTPAWSALTGWYRLGLSIPSGEVLACETRQVKLDKSTQERTL